MSSSSPEDLQKVAAVHTADRRYAAPDANKAGQPGDSSGAASSRAQAVLPDHVVLKVCLLG